MRHARRERRSAATQSSDRMKQATSRTSGYGESDGESARYRTYRGIVRAALIRRQRLEIAAIKFEKKRDVRVGHENYSALRRSLWAVAAVILLAPAQAFAQQRRRKSVSSQRRNRRRPRRRCPAPGRPAPRSSRRIHWRRAPLAQAVPLVPAGHVALAVAARYGRDAPLISGGLIWRVYAAKPDATGIFRLIKEDRAAAPTFMLPPGNYVVHASLGLASAAKAVQLRAETVREVFEIPAGGIRLEGRVGDVRIPTGQISFDIYHRQPVRNHRTPADRAERDDGRRRAAARGHLLHRVELRRRQFGGAFRRPRAGRASSPISSSPIAPRSSRSSW